MNSTAKSVLVTALGVIVAGLAMYYGGNLPLISDARKAFDGRAK
jgi:hypothetical protein